MILPTTTKNNRKLSVKKFKRQTENFIIENAQQRLIVNTSTEHLKNYDSINHNSIKSWTKNQKLASHFEGYISPIQEQEIPTILTSF